LAADNIQRNAWLTLKNSDKDLTIFEKQIAAAHPQNILKRGYALIRNEEGSILDFEKINLHQSINIELIDGIVKTTVQEKQKNG
jgi:exonuclease VII large subunit